MPAWPPAPQSGRPADPGPRRAPAASRRPRLRPRAAGTRDVRAHREPVAARRVRRRERRASRLTGRAAVLVLVLAVLTVSYASSLRAYLQQRSHIGELKVQIAEREASINDLEREKKRWDDPAYVKAQARARFGYLMPGETGYEVIGADGEPLERAGLPQRPRRRDQDRAHGLVDVGVGVGGARPETRPRPRRSRSTSSTGPSSERRDPPRQPRSTQPTRP